MRIPPWELFALSQHPPRQLIHTLPPLRTLSMTLSNENVNQSMESGAYEVINNVVLSSFDVHFDNNKVAIEKVRILQQLCKAVTLHRIIICVPLRRQRPSPDNLQAVALEVNRLVTPTTHGSRDVDKVWALETLSVKQALQPELCDVSGKERCRIHEAFHVLTDLTIDTFPEVSTTTPITAAEMFEMSGGAGWRPEELWLWPFPVQEPYKLLQVRLHERRCFKAIDLPLHVVVLDFSQLHDFFVKAKRIRPICTKVKIHLSPPRDGGRDCDMLSRDCDMLSRVTTRMVQVDTQQEAKRGD